MGDSASAKNLDANRLLQAAISHHQAGRFAEAQTLYRQLLAAIPDFAPGLNAYGLLALHTGNLGAAVELLRKAIEAQPDFVVAHINLGEALRLHNRLDEALAVCQRATELGPLYPEAHNNLGLALSALGRHDEAAEAYRRAIQLRANFPEAWGNLAIALRHLGSFDESISACEQALALRPAFPTVLTTLGNVFKDLNRIDEAIDAFRGAIKLQPGFSVAHANLSQALQSQGAIDEAIIAAKTAIGLTPDSAQAHQALARSLMDAGEIDDAIARFRRAMALAPTDPLAHSDLIFALHFHPESTPDSLAGEHAEWNRIHALPQERLQLTIDRNPNRRLRVGFVSPDFCAHPVGRFILPLLENYDRDSFEIACYAQIVRADEMTERIRGLASRWRDISRMSDEEAAATIRDDGIDVLIDLAMHTGHNRLRVFARKPAPVQVSYLAYCSSTGVEAIDYRLSDPWLDPDDDDSKYAERTVRLPGTYWCYQPLPLAGDVGPLPCGANGPVTFGCLNSFFKVSRPLVAAWEQLMKAVPDSRLILHSPEGAHRRKLLEAIRVEPQRVEFVTRVSGEAYFNLYNRIDIALDTFPYAGGTTTCDALWMGVPVVTLAGRTGVGRSGVSILNNAGVPELVADSKDRYVEIACALAANRSHLATLRRSLRDRMRESPLMNALQFARDFEGTVRKIWENFCAHP